MAFSGTVTHSHQGTAGTAMDTVNFARACSSILLANRGAVDIWYKTSNQGTANPVANNDETMALPAGSSRTINDQVPITAVRLITASSTSVYSVECNF